MNRRFLAFLATLALLGFFTGAKAADVFPAHPYAAMLVSLGLVGYFVAWQILYRTGALPEESAATRALAWTASVGMGVWATYLIFSAGVSLVDLVLRGAAAHALPALAAGASVVVAFFGLGQAVAGPIVREVAVPVADLAPGLKDLRIAQISDLHIGPTIRRADVDRVVDAVLALKPDLIAVTGDMADGSPERLARHVEPLSRLKAPLGVFFVTGNHEYYWGAERWVEKIRRLGLTVLLNENRVVERGGARLLVAGIPDESGGAFVPGHFPDVASAAGPGRTADYRLLLAHRPDGVPAAERAGFDLQLSGHTHGGQFFPASLFISLFHRFSRGLSRHRGMHVHVNPGTGYWGPANRFAVPSEITLLTLENA
jgi:predicted MPP superfamily phosphohydrolase